MQHVPFFCVYPRKFQSDREEQAIYAVSNFDRKFLTLISYVRYKRVITDDQCSLSWTAPKRRVQDLSYFVYELCTKLTSLSQSAEVSNKLDPTQIDGIFTIGHLTITLNYFYNASSSSMHIEVASCI